MIIEPLAPGNIFLVRDELTEDWTTLSKVELRDWLVRILTERSVTLKFEKKDGSIREMAATLKSDVVVPYEKKTDREKSVNEDVLPVFDLDKKEWRSFRVGCLSEVNFTL